MKNRHALRRSGLLPKLVIMAKEPVAGRIKTRLAREAGVTAAVRFQRSNLTHAVLRLSADPRWLTYLAVAPATAIASRMFPARGKRIAQPRGDLGTRIAAPLAGLPPGPVVIIGADIPGITRAVLARAFAALKTADAVFGPAPDGGYWLIGLTHRARRVGVFENVRWSSQHALADTRANLARFRVATIAHMRDVDDARDLAQVGAAATRLIVSVSNAAD